MRSAGPRGTGFAFLAHASHTLSISTRRHRPMAKLLKFDADARDALRRGVEKMARALKTTLGPRGNPVVLDKGWGAPQILDDGASVADEIELTDPYENIGAQMVKQASSKTGDDAG